MQFDEHRREGRGGWGRRACAIGRAEANRVSGLHGLIAYLDQPGGDGAHPSFSGRGSNALATTPPPSLAEMERPGTIFPRRVSNYRIVYNPDGVHPGVDRRGHQDLVGGRAARRPRHYPLSADRGVCGDHPDRRHSGVADRHFRGSWLAVGITFNSLSLFGLVLAIGIAADDAIVVVENVERNLAQDLPRAMPRSKRSTRSDGAIAIFPVLIEILQRHEDHAGVGCIG